MKSKWLLVSSVIQTIIGLAGIASFVILALNGENMSRWIITLILSIAYTVLGIIGVIDYNSDK